jgi:hypothetical protein
MKAPTIPKIAKVLNYEPKSMIERWALQPTDKVTFKIEFDPYDKEVVAKPVKPLFSLQARDGLAPISLTEVPGGIGSEELLKLIEKKFPVRSDAEAKAFFEGDFKPFKVTVRIGDIWPLEAIKDTMEIRTKDDRLIQRALEGELI